jgi:hypothetical protein
MNRWRTAYAALLLICPSLVARRSARTSPDRRTRRVMRLLGVRHLVQAILESRHASPVVMAIGAGVDVLHAASMVIFASTDRRHRRLALIDAGVASSLALAGAWSAVALTRPVAARRIDGKP